MIRALVLGIVIAAALPSCKREERAPATRSHASRKAPAAAASAQAPTPAELVSGPLPDGPEADMAHAQCTVCHDEEYLVQQRLSPAAWQKTLAKMQKFGANVNDEQAARLATWLSTLYPPDLPMRSGALVERPVAALPPAP